MPSWNVLIPTIIAAVISSIVFLGAIAYALQRWRKEPRAAKYVVIAIGILAGSWLTRTFIIGWTSRAFGAATLGQVAMWTQVVNTLMFAVSIIFFVAAAFVDRDRKPTETVRDEFLPGAASQQPPNSNPYAASSEA